MKGRIASQNHIGRKVVTAILLLSFVFGTLPKPVFASDADSPTQVANSIITSAKSTISAAAALITKGAAVSTAGSTATSAILNAAQNTKEYVLDTLAWQVAQLAIQSMTKSLVNWINSGFQGSPGFVTDLKKNLQGIDDAVAAHFFKELSSQDITTTPFQDKVLDAVRLSYYLSTSPESFYTKNPYTLNQVSSDDKAFLNGDFSKGGWNAWFATIMNPQNNPYAAQELANRVLGNTTSEATNGRIQELSWNKGFLSWRGDCTQFAPTAPTNTTITTNDLSGVTIDSSGQASGSITSTSQQVSLANEDKCLNYSIKTPGTVIEAGLEKQFGATVDKLVTADEFDEIISALMNQLVGHILGANDSGGLAGASKPKAGGGASFLDQATSATNNSNTTETQNIQNSFAATLADQKKHVTDFQTAWEKIRTAAQAAKDKCGEDVGVPSAQDVIDEADVALAKAANSLEALNSIDTRAQASNNSGDDQTPELLSVSNDYQTLLSSGTLPTTDEFARATTESTDTGDASPASLYTSMTKISTAPFCPGVSI